MKTPKFWQKVGPLSLILWPVSFLYLAIARIRYKFQATHKFNKKVICVGGITVGGSSKTPIAIALAKLLIKKNHTVAFACKSYKAKLKNPQIVKKHNQAKIQFDEAILLSQVAPTAIANTRLEAVKLATTLDSEIIIVDDGMQNNTFYKDLTILAINDLHNLCIFPSGPLREPLEDGIKKADIVIFATKNQICKSSNKPYLCVLKKFKLRLGSAIAKSSIAKNKRCLAFAGIAFPEQFFLTLKELGFNVVEARSFADHHQYSNSEIFCLIEEAKKNNLHLITTEKDLGKIPYEYAKQISTLVMTIDFTDKDRAYELIMQRINTSYLAPRFSHS